MAPITSFYGALAALLWVVLASNVILKRNRHQVGMGDGGNPHLARAVRVHANAVEYVPITRILMLLFELEHGRALQLHISGLALVGGRIVYPIGLSRRSGNSCGRALGIAATFVAILLPATGILMKTDAQR